VRFGIVMAYILHELTFDFTLFFTFCSRDCPVSDRNPGIELNTLAKIRDLLRERLSPYHNHHTSSYSFNPIKIKPRPPCDTYSTVEKSVSVPILMTQHKILNVVRC